MGWHKSFDQAIEKVVPGHRGLVLPTIDIPSPPCQECQHWRPMVQADSKGHYNGIRLCHAEAMYRDFSCFAAR